MKKELFVFLVFVGIVFAGCSPTLEQSGESVSSDTPSMNVSGSGSGDVSSDTSDTARLEENNFSLEDGGPCSSGWYCPSERHKAYRFDNCTNRNLERCDYGCLEGGCKKRPYSNVTCTSGFKCKNADTKAFQLESCSWESAVACEYGCEAGKCLPKPNGTSSGTTPEPEEASVVYTTLKPGEEQQLAGNHTIRIYLLEEGRVKIKVDGLRSDWLEEGMNAPFSTGVTVIIGEILFQSYEGGVKQVGYVVK